MIKHIKAGFITIRTSGLKLTNATLFWIVGVSLILILIFAVIPPFNYWTFQTGDLRSSLFADYGQFISGILGTIFSLLGVILLFKTLKEQRHQFLKSSFESNFYSLLENHRDLLNSISDQVEEMSDVEESGTDFFADLSQRIAIDFGGKTITFDNTEIIPVEITKNTGVTRLIDIYAYYFHIHHSSLSHYFRNLYYFFRFIIESDVDEASKNRHIKMLRAQLSNYEVLILAYNCLHKYGYKFKAIVEKYELLHNLHFETELNSQYFLRIIDPQILINEYPRLSKSYAEQ